MKTQHFEIHWPADMRPQKAFPTALPDVFQPLYTGLENAWVSGTPGGLALQRLPGGHIHFGHLQSHLSEPRTIRIATSVPTLFFTACQAGEPRWSFPGQREAVTAEPDTHFAVGLPPGETSLALPAGYCGFCCYILAGYRLQLVARDHPMLKPAIDALRCGGSGDALLLPPCPVHQDTREQFQYLRTKKVGPAAKRNILYKNRLHRLVSIYHGQLGLLAERVVHSRRGVFQRAMALMERRRDAPAYGIAELAGELAVSVRQVQYAFREHGTTFTREWNRPTRTAYTQSGLE